jgi:hypothetical protein
MKNKDNQLIWESYNDVKRYPIPETGQEGEELTYETGWNRVNPAMNQGNEYMKFISIFRGTEKIYERGLPDEIANAPDEAVRAEFAKKVADELLAKGHH